MKKLFSLSVLLCSVASVQAMKLGSGCSISGAIVDYDQETRTNLFAKRKHEIVKAIHSFENDSLSEALNNRKEDIKQDFEFYTKKLTTLDEKGKKEKIAQLMTNVLTEQETYSNEFKMVRVPDLKKTQEDFSRQKISSLCKGLTGCAKITAAVGCGYMILNPDAIQYGNFSLGKLPVVQGTVTVLGLFGLGSIFGLAGANNLSSAFTGYFDAKTKLKIDEERCQRTNANCNKMENLVKEFNFFDACDSTMLKKAKEFAQERSDLADQLLRAQISYYSKP